MAASSPGFGRRRRVDGQPDHPAAERQRGLHAREGLVDERADALLRASSAAW
jgi:hypothetical protein